MKKYNVVKFAAVIGQLKLFILHTVGISAHWIHFLCPRWICIKKYTRYQMHGNM